MILASIPSPARGVWHLGPIPVRAYALCIIAGVVVAVIMTQKRWVARGGLADDVVGVALWAVPFGILGGRLYHVVTSPELYFAAGKEPVRALLPWALRIDAAHRPADSPDIAGYHPTFLYESLWRAGIAVVLVWAERRYQLGRGSLFALCVAGYTLGRVWVEGLRSTTPITSWACGSTCGLRPSSSSPRSGSSW